VAPADVPPIDQEEDKARPVEETIDVVMAK
jgi:hypothetical protein